MTIDEALQFADILGDLNGKFNETEFKSEVTLTLAAEVRRLRAGVEAVRALERYADVEESQYGVVKRADGEWIYRDDVLGALEITDD